MRVMLHAAYQLVVFPFWLFMLWLRTIACDLFSEPLLDANAGANNDDVTHQQMVMAWTMENWRVITTDVFIQTCY